MPQRNIYTIFYLCNWSINRIALFYWVILVCNTAWADNSKLKLKHYQQEAPEMELSEIKLHYIVNNGAKKTEKTQKLNKPELTHGFKIKQLMKGYQTSIILNLTQDNYIFYTKDNAELFNDNQIRFKLLQKYDSINYGLFYRLNTNTSAAKNGYIKLGQQGMFFLESDYGKLELGNYPGIASTFAAYNNRYELENNALSYLLQSQMNLTQIPQVLLNKGLWSEQQGLGLSRNNIGKVNYTTPTVNNTRLGFSLAPSSYNSKNPFIEKVQPIRAFEAASAYNDVYQVGCHYSNMISNHLGLKFSLVGEYGRPRSRYQSFVKNNISFIYNADIPQIKVAFLRSWEVAMSATYMGIIISSSYAQSSSGFANKKANSYSLQLMYHIQRMVLAAKHFKSTNQVMNNLISQSNKLITQKIDNQWFIRSKSNLTRQGLQLSYKLADGLVPYLEGGWGKYRVNNIKKAHIKGLMLGLYLSI